ncbi:hypothetical protein [Sphingopyxis witflariensis]|uniref:hypothetical protein n=1 Tax=Sphingopyxis witflariensis TaxID=173675 RepID=UPI000B4E2A49|nr:hypothetical protein [Sphingopyxis witflariensis]
MNGGASQFARVLATLPYDTPLADRWHQLGEDIEQHGRDIDEARSAHRSDCLARYGEDIFGDGK